MIEQEIHRKNGYAIQEDEEVLRAHLEASVAELNSPTQLKVDLSVKASLVVNKTAAIL